MAKCSACGRFIAATDVAKCKKCPCEYHRQCVGLSEKSLVSTSWTCPSCKPKKPKGDNADTPVKALNSEDSCEEELPHKSVTSSAPVTVPNSDNNLLLEVREELRALRLDIQSYRNEVAELKDAMTLHNTKLSNLDTRVDHLETHFREVNPSRVRELEATVMLLRNDLIERDQLTLANDVEISNLPEEAGENSTHLAILIGAKLGVKLEDRDLVFAERVGQKRASTTMPPGSETVAATAQRPRTLVVRFARRAKHGDFLKAARVRRGITSGDLGLTAESRRFYVNERLTKHNRQVFHKARELCREFNWKFVWTKYGITYVRQVQEKSAYRAINLENLNRIFCSD